MRPIQLLILLVAFGSAGMAGMIAMNMTAAPAPEPQMVAAEAPAMPTEEVLVATADLSTGTAVTADRVSWRRWPADGISDGFITRKVRPDAVSEFKGTLVRDPIFAGEPIRDAKLVRSDRGFLSAILPPGMRAVAVRVNAASTAGGFILPNDRVDVILIRQSSGGAVSGATSETILTNVRVLAIDQTVESVTDDKKSVVVAQDTATLELSPEDAELITQAQQVGTISLSLRSIKDQTVDSQEQRRPTGVSVVKYGIPSRVTARESQ